MVYERYNKRMYDKLEAVNKLYASRIFKKVGEPEAPMYLETKEHFRLPPEDGWKPLEKGLRWGGEWVNLWIRGRAVVPAEAAGKKLYAVSHANAREILFFVDGKPSGIFNSTGDYIGTMHCAEKICEGPAGEVHELAFECYAWHFCAGCAPYSEYGKDEGCDAEFMRTYNGIDLCVMDEPVKDFVFDLQAVLQMAQVLPDNNFLKARARNTLEQVYGELIQSPLHCQEDVWHASLERCREIMADVLHHSAPERTRGYVGIIGHSHMDTAWLWPIDETVRKCARTYANALSLMDQYPDYHFIQSSSLHLDWMRRYYPDIFEGIKKRTAEGRYEPNGGVWVECDCNITSGEAMVRQFLKGQRFTRKYLNYTSDTFWLPDTFGYNAAIPQIMRESGVKYFYTQKLSFNDLNTFPYDTFIWRGSDGSEVISHFFIMQAAPNIAQVNRAIDQICHKQVFGGKLMAFGMGDGGGGPTYGMLEQAKRSSNLEGMPAVEPTTVSQFMQKIESEAVNLPVYSGELYFELHRGTLTQMHDIKRGNRKAEFALHDMEFMNVLTGLPKNEKSDELWEILLKNQFHDILPGTSITPVNVLARQEFAKVIREAAAETDAYATSLVSGDDAVTFFNPLSFDCEGIVYLDGIPMGQPFTDVCGRERTAVDVGCIPALSAVSMDIADQPVDLSLKFVYDEDLRTLRTKFATVRFDENGFIASLIDHQTNREVRREGGAPLNCLTLVEEVPENHDNWDIDNDICFKKPERVDLVSRRVVSHGAYELRIRSEYAIGQHSRLVQDMIFSARSPRIDFHTLVDWKEKHRLLKAGFDVDVAASHARHEMQFGYTERPTTRNNCFEAVQFEVCNHKWTDLSDTRFGVAILNDCKYGISAEGSDMRLTLHRGGCRPDVTGDEGLHEMTYSLLPHAGSFSAETVVRPAYRLNNPPIVCRGRLRKEIPSLLKLSSPNVICEAIKPAEDEENAIVVRLYECERSRTSCDITLPPHITEARIVNMLEETREVLEINDHTVTVDFGPFKIITLLLK